LLATLGYCYGKTGRSAEAKRIIAELGALATHHFVARMDLALIHTGLSDVSGALDLLERANEEHEFWAAAIPNGATF
jgi:hypothetical protein